MRVLRIARWTFLTLVVLAAAAAGVFVATFDMQVAVGRLAAQVHRATGRDLAVAGQIRPVWSWPPELVADHATLSNPPGLSRPSMATVDQVRVRLALRPLLSGRVDLDVTLVHPDVLLERGNWQFHPEPVPVPTGPSTPSRPPPVRTELRWLRVENGQIGVRDATGVRTVAVPVATVRLAEGGGGTLTARVAGDHGTADLSASAGPAGWPLHAQADGSVDAGVLHIAGMQADAPGPDTPGHLKAALTIRGLPLALDVAVPAPGHIAPNSPLPFTLAAAAAGASLTAQGTVADLAAVSGLDAVVSARIPDLPALAPLAGTALPALGAVSFDGRVLDRGGNWAVRSLRLQAAPGNLSGDVALGWSGRPSLRGTLSSTRLDVDALVAALPRPSAPPSPSPSPSSAPAAIPAAPTHLIPDWALPVRQLGAADVDIAVSLANLVLGRVPVPALAGHVFADSGRVRLDPVAITFPGGRAVGRASADASAVPPTWSLDARATGLRLDQLTEAVHGIADGDLSLNATGDTVRAVAASLDGHANVQLTQGDIDNRLLAPVLDAALRAARVNLDLSGRSALRCLLLPLTASHGTISTAGLLLDAGRIRLEGEGSADLATETLALQLRPTLRVGGAGIGAPVRVSGPWAHPTAVLDAGQGRVGLTIGPPAPDPDGCGPPPPSEPKPEKPADLLRRLLR